MSDLAYDVDDLEYWRCRRPDDVPDGFKPSLDGPGGLSTWSSERYCRRCDRGLADQDTYCRNCGEPA